MKFEEALELAEGLSKHGIKPGLLAISELLETLGNPEKNLKFIHIAGTNGKGSTGAFIASILVKAGYKVGVYSSPKVFDEKEIIRVNGRNITKESYVNLTQKIFETGKEFTRFEFETAMALLYFKEKNCDLVVWECGMGGKEDATNVVNNTEVAVFTAIGMDHMAYLGKNVSEISANKAGIIKPGASVVINGINPEVTDELCKHTDSSNKVYITDTNEITHKKLILSGSSFSYKNFSDLHICLLGENQLENAVVAIETIFALRERKYVIPDKCIRNGLHNTTEHGRFEVIPGKPVFVLDGAHNEPASKRLRENILKYFSKKKIIYILSVLKDKEYDKLIENTCDLAWQVITATSPNRQRALPAFELASAVSLVNPNVSCADGIEEAVELAKMMSDSNTVVIVFGSLSHLNKAKQAIDKDVDVKRIGI